MEILKRAQYLTHSNSKNGSIIKNVFFFAKCPLGSQNYCIKEDGSCYDFITHIFSRWPEVNEKLFPPALVLFGFDPGSKIQRESRRTWEEDLGPGRRTGKPRSNSTCPAAAQLPFLQKFHPQAFGCLPGILTP